MEKRGIGGGVGRVPGGGERAARFATVGITGAVVNLAALHLFAAVLRLPEIASSALAIETSILWNFVWHEAFTFRDRRHVAAAGRAGRLARYNAVSLVGALIQLGTFTAAALVLSSAFERTDLGPLRYLAQGAGIAIAFAWSFTGSSRYAWAADTVAAPRAPPASRRWVAPTLFAALVVLHVAPIWLVAWFPTQDGPLHVENVLALLNLRRSPLLQHWYLENWGAQPNWLTQALLAALLQWVSPVTGEKLVLTGYTVLFPLAFRSVLPRGTRGWWGALAAFPFVHAFPFHMGFWNFVYGYALAFLVVGAWWRSRGRLGPARFLLLAILAVLLFLAHTVAFAGAAVVIAALLLWRATLSFHRSRGNAARRGLVVRAYALRAAVTLLAAAPGLSLIAVWLLAHRDRVSGRIPFLELAAKLVTGYALVSIDRREIVLAALVMLAMFVGAVHLLLARGTRGPRLRPGDGWLLASVLFAVLYFAVPDVVAAGAHVSDRFGLFTLVSFAVWLVGGGSPAGAQRRIAGALALVALAALGVRFQKQLALSSYIDEYVSAKDALEPGRVLLPIAMLPTGPRDAHGYALGYRVKPFLHATGWIVAERGGVDLKNSQANTDHCPVKFPADRNPFRTIAQSLGRMEGMPPCVDLAAAVGASVDYVLVWGASSETLRTPCGGALASDLSARYEPIYLSQPRGMLEIWRPRTTTASR